MRKFKDIYETACLHKGGKKQLEVLLPKALTDKQLKAQSDEFYLSNMCRRVFRAGLKHSLVDKKWPAFEKAFHSFDPMHCAMLSEDDIDQHMKDTSIIRHRGKLNSVQINGQFLMEKSREYCGFGAYLTEWTSEQTVDLWWELKKQAKQMGGNSGPAFLRMVGKDTFLFTRDVVAVLKVEGVIDREPTSKKDMLASQNAFLQWQNECGRSLCEISRIVSCTANY